MDDSVLKAVARKVLIAYWVRNVHGKSDDELFLINAEQALRDIGLGELLAAGHAMRDELDDFGEPYAAQCQADWDAAKAKLLAGG